MENGDCKKTDPSLEEVGGTYIRNINCMASGINIHSMKSTTISMPYNGSVYIVAIIIYGDHSTVAVDDTTT